VERLDGDPLRLLIVCGPGWAKTETVSALKDCGGALIVSTLSSTGALLSATSKRERTDDATGGLLKKLEPRGIMVLKDVTSILSLNPGMRAEVLAALREVYDGCDVVTVRRALGHSSAAITLTTYSHLWPDANDRTRRAAGELLEASLGAAADPLRTESKI
jgi:hypothetical protein